MDRVIVGVDGSEDANAALRWAAVLAERLGLPLHAISAWQYPADVITEVGRIELPSPDAMHRDVEARVQRNVADVLGDDAGSVTVEVVRGPTADALLREARLGARILVVGSRGRGGFPGLVLGSVSRQVTDHAPCPVTVVRASGERRPARLDRIAVGVDGSAHGRRALVFAGEVATATGAALTVVHATGARDADDAEDIGPRIDLDARRDWVEEWCEPLQEAGVEHDISVVRGDPRTAVLDAARADGADLVVVGSRGRGPVTRLVLGSVAAALTHDSELPVTVVPTPED